MMKNARAVVVINAILSDLGVILPFPFAVDFGLHSYTMPLVNFDAGQAQRIQATILKVRN